MFEFIFAAPSELQIAFHVVGFLSLTFILMLGIHRVVPVDVRREHNDVIGFIVAVVAVFYGLIIASVLVIAIGRLDQAQRVVANEANVLGDVVRNARAISPEMDGVVRPRAARYLDDVINTEWPAQVRGERTLLGLSALSELAHAVSLYEPKNQREGAFYLQLIGSLNRLYDARRERLFLADEKIAGEVWAVTLAGAVLTICLTLLFGVQNRWIHFLLASFLAVSLALIFALVMIFDRPFQGNMAASDEPYRVVLQQVTASHKH
jgi:hypothetical protein